jgi:hypothetical protein
MRHLDYLTGLERRHVVPFGGFVEFACHLPLHECGNDRDRHPDRLAVEADDRLHAIAGPERPKAVGRLERRRTGNAGISGPAV